jgi:four helix bundle protein
VQHFTRLKVWAKAHELNLAVQSATKTFPSASRYTIVAQLQRCAASIPANIVEGTACSSDRETARYLVIARRSAAETEYFLMMARDTRLLPQTSYAQMN